MGLLERIGAGVRAGLAAMKKWLGEHGLGPIIDWWDLHCGTSDFFGYGAERLVGRYPDENSPTGFSHSWRGYGKEPHSWPKRFHANPPRDAIIARQGLTHVGRGGSAGVNELFAFDCAARRKANPKTMKLADAVADAAVKSAVGGLKAVAGTAELAANLVGSAAGALAARTSGGMPAPVAEDPEVAAARERTQAALAALNTAAFRKTVADQLGRPVRTSLDDEREASAVGLAAHAYASAQRPERSLVRLDVCRGQPLAWLLGRPEQELALLAAAGPVAVTRHIEGVEQIGGVAPMPPKARQVSEVTSDREALADRMHRFRPDAEMTSGHAYHA